KFLLSDINLKQDPELVERVTAHLMEHIELLRNTDPGLLAAMGQQPIGPAGGTPNNPMDPNQEVNNAAGDGQIEEVMDPAAAMGNLPEAQGISEPNMPTPPPVNDPRQL